MDPSHASHGCSPALPPEGGGNVTESIHSERNVGLEFHADGFCDVHAFFIRKRFICSGLEELHEIQAAATEHEPADERLIDCIQVRTQRHHRRSRHADQVFLKIAGLLSFLWVEPQWCADEQIGIRPQAGKQRAHQPSRRIGRQVLDDIQQTDYPVLGQPLG